jgi:leucyl aminopeptidase
MSSFLIQSNQRKLQLLQLLTVEVKLLVFQQRYHPKTIIDLATLTGAMIVSLGHEYGGLFSNDDTLADNILAAGKTVGDKLWRMPMGDVYDKMIDSPIADMKNLGDGPMGGSITAALFLKAFVNAPSWAHFDIWAWRPARYGRPAGAAACGLRAVWAMLKKRYV